MPSKNPVKGYILCPTKGCGEICSVHAVGEHKAMTEGETPKNPRRLGQLYTICPNCKTNQSAGKPFQTWLSANMQATKEALKPVSDAVIDPVKQTDEPNVKPINKAVTKPNQTSKHGVLEKDEVTEPKPDETEKSNLIGWAVSLIGFVSLCGIIYLSVSSGKKKQEGAACKKTM